MNADKILLKILQKVEVAGGETRELILMNKLKEFLQIPLYTTHMEAVFSLEGEKATGTANAILNKAVSLYNIKEYKRSSENILANIFSFNPLNTQLVKLLIANLQGMKHFLIAAGMYYEYYAMTKEIDCLYFAGICHYMAQNNSNAIKYFKLFLKHALESGGDKYKELIKNCNNIIKLIEAA